MFEGEKVGVVVPAYNEEKLISGTLEGIPDYVDTVIVVDDASSDKTGEKTRSAAKKDERILLIQHGKNMGVGQALITGYQHALQENCSLIAVMAGDNQMDPKYLPKLLKPLTEDKADYTKGNRLIGAHSREGMPKFRLLGNSILSFLTKVCSGYWDVVDPQNGYTAIKSDVLESIGYEDMYPRFGYPNDMLVKLNIYGYRIRDVGIPARYGSEKSKIRYPSYIPKVSKILLEGFFYRLKEKYVLQSFHPLIFFYLMGFTLTPLSILVGLYMAYLRFVSVGSITAASVLLPVFLFTVGLQSLFFAMLFDMEATRK